MAFGFASKLFVSLLEIEFLKSNLHVNLLKSTQNELCNLVLGLESKKDILRGADCSRGSQKLLKFNPEVTTSWVATKKSYTLSYRMRAIITRS